MKKNIIAIIAVIALAFGTYFIVIPMLKFKDSPREELSREAFPPETNEFQGINYEIISVGGPIYDVVTGSLSEDQVKALAEHIIDKAIIENPESKELTLFFYSDIIAAGAGESDVAKIIWTPNETKVQFKQ